MGRIEEYEVAGGCSKHGFECPACRLDAAEDDLVKLRRDLNDFIERNDESERATRRADHNTDSGNSS